MALSLAVPPEPARAPIDGAQIPVEAPAAPRIPAVAPRSELPQTRSAPRVNTVPGPLVFVPSWDRAGLAGIHPPRAGAAPRERAALHQLAALRDAAVAGLWR